MFQVFKKSALLNKLNNSTLFLELFCFALCVFAFLGWKYNYILGMSIIIPISCLALILFNNFKYMIPCLLSLILSYGNGFDSDSSPIPIIVIGFSLLGILILYTIKNGINIKKAKSGVGLAVLTILCIIPILWYNIIPDGKEVFYFIYFSYLLYFVIYILYAVSLKEDSFNMIVIAMHYVAVLLATECVSKILELSAQNPDANIFSFAYSLGWGICNEAGIMLCVSAPFIFITLIRSKNNVEIILAMVKLNILIIGILLTTSRGSYLFGFIELTLLVIYTLAIKKNRIKLFFVYSVSVILLLTFLQQVFGIPELITYIEDYVFHNDLSDNGRYYLWRQAVEVWNSGFINRFLGSGVVSLIAPRGSFNGVDEVFIVFHSTFFEVLASFGTIGCLALAYHFYEKYIALANLDRKLIPILLIGFGIIDIYGMIDNTYGMHYFMIPLVMLMASLDQIKGKDYTVLF